MGLKWQDLGFIGFRINIAVRCRSGDRQLQNRNFPQTRGDRRAHSASSHRMASGEHIHRSSRLGMGVTA